MDDHPVCVVLASHGASLGGGAERCLIDLAVALHADGRVLPTVTVPREGDLALSLKERRVPVMVLPTPWWTIEPVRGEFLASARAARQRARVARAIARSVPPWYGWLREQRPQAVMTNTAVIPTPGLASRLAGIPHLIWLHELMTPDHGLAFAFGSHASRRAISLLSGTVATVSQTVRRHYSPTVPMSKTRVVHCGITGFSTSPNVVRTPGLEALMLGTVKPGKNPELAIEAAHVLQEEGVPFRLRLVGDVTQEYREELGRLATRHGVSNRIEIAGATQNPNLEIAGANVMVTCSQNEALGRVTVEALKSGRPVVGVRSGGTTELISDGENGLLVPPGDARALASALRRLATEPGLLTRLSENASASIRGRFTIEAEVEAFVALFRAIQR